MKKSFYTHLGRSPHVFFRLKRFFVYGIFLFSIFFFVGFAWVVFAGKDPYLADPNIRFQDEGNPLFGSDSALVTVRIYGDFSCEACRETWASFRSAMQEHQQDVFFVWNDFPTTSEGVASAVAARCAQEQGRFWIYADALYDQQTSWRSLERPRSFFIRLADNLGLQKNRFSRCLDRSLSLAKVQRDLHEAEAFDFSAVPVFFFNRSMHVGGLDAMQFTRRLNLVR